MNQPETPTVPEPPAQQPEGADAAETNPETRPAVGASSNAAQAEVTPAAPAAASAETTASEPDTQAPDATASAAEPTPAEAGGEAAAETPDVVPAEAAAPAQGEDGKDKEKKGKGGAKRKRKRTRGPRSARAEEFVTPTPEDLAGLPSDIVRTAVADGLPVGGKVIGWNQGGFHVVVEGISSFCPRSSMELGPPHEPAQYLDKEYLFRVLRVEEGGKRLVLSRAAILLEEKRHQIEETRKSLQVGAVLTGKVVSLVDFGAFVDLGGVEGLLHVSELRHSRVEHPSAVLTVGQEVEVKVIKMPKKGERASLSMRALEPSPWDGATDKWPAGGRFSGTVMRKSEFGWFVELAPGVEGLLHTSQLEPGMKPEDERLADGATLEGWVREIDPGRHRISLSLREVPTGNPWSGVDHRYPEGAVVKGTIERIAPFGAFVVLEPGLTGLLPASEMGLPRGASIGKAFPVGKEISLKVAEVDARRRRISLTREDKTLEGSKSDYHAYLKKSRKSDGMGALAAAFERLKSAES